MPHNGGHELRRAERCPLHGVYSLPRDHLRVVFCSMALVCHDLLAFQVDVFDVLPIRRVVDVKVAIY